MNIDDLRRDIAGLEDEGQDEFASELSMLAYAWEEEDEDLDLAIANFQINYIDYPIPNFMNSDIDWEKVAQILKEKEL